MPPQLEERRPAMSPQLARRVALLGSLALVLFAALFFRLWFLQVLSGDDYVSQAAQNKVRKIRIEAPRGDIVDRNGRKLVKTRQAAVVQILPNKLPQAEIDVATHYAAQVSAAERVRLAANDRLKNFDRALRREDLKKKKLKPGQKRVRRRLVRAASHAVLPPIPDIPTDPIVQRLFRTLGQVIHVPPREIHKRVIQQYAQTPYAAITVKTGIGRPAFNYLGERQDQFPGVHPEIQYLRTYPYKTIGAQLFGTVREIDPSQLKEKQYQGLSEGDRIGAGGLEQSYDKYLRGQDGYTRQVVDAFGQPCDDQVKCPVRQVKPQQGQQLELTLDMGLEKAATEAVQRGIDAAAGNGSNAGAFVAMDPRDGSILALGSLPSYDANEFAKPISQEKYNQLNSDEAGKPLLNRAIDGLYPTGSTFKIVTAMASLEAGNLTTSRTINDPGTFKLGPQVYQNAGGEANGLLTLVPAIKVSSDVFFYNLGAELFSKPGQVLQTWARKFGFGHTTGIDLPGEFGGLVPDAKWRNTAYAKYTACRKAAGLEADTYENAQAALYKCGGIDRPYTQGDNVNLAVGQGDLQATPLQLATAYSALANGGTVVRPHLGQAIEDGQGIVQQKLTAPARAKVGFDSAFRAPIMEGLHEAATSPGGTSADVFKGFPYANELYGKTGTAERGNDPDQAWYVCYVDDPAKPIVVAVTIEKGGFGAETAAPAARLILSHWFDVKDNTFHAGSSTTR